MATKKPVRVPDTDKTINVGVTIAGSPTVDSMESILEQVARELGMEFSRITTLGAVRYPGNRHWHLKRHPRERGCLDVTYWPDGPIMWISIRRYEPEWVHQLGRKLGPALERRMGTER